MDDPKILRRQAIEANNECWRLLEKPDRSPAETEAMIAAAHRCLALWEKVGTGVNLQRGVWMVARTSVDAGRAEPALDYARRTLELTARHAGELADFDFAFAEEVAARAEALAGDTAAAAAHYAAARKLGEAIKEPGDRKEFFRQLASGPWFGLGVAGDPATPT